MSIDLHTHSWFSDGTKSPTELVQLAEKSGVTALAITDHDTMDGVGEALAAGVEYGVEVVPGLEISVMHKKIALQSWVTIWILPMLNWQKHWQLCRRQEIAGTIKS